MARGIRSFGFDVVLLREVYTNDAMYTADVEWIEHSAERGFTVLTANPAIAGVDHEIAAIRQFGAQVFTIANVKHNRDTRGMIFGRHWLQIVRRSQRAGPCLWRLNANSTVTYDIS